MPDEKTLEKGEEQEQEKELKSEKAPAEEKKTETRENMIPQSRLNEVLTRAKDAEEKLANIEAAQRKATEERLVEQGKYKELHESQGVELAEAKVQVAQLEDANKALDAVYEAQIESIPEKLRGLIPETLGTREKLAYIAANATLLSKASPINVGSGKRGGGNEDKAVILTEDQKVAADNAGVSHEEYAKYTNN